MKKIQALSYRKLFLDPMMLKCNNTYRLHGELHGVQELQWPFAWEEIVSTWGKSLRA